MAQFPSAFVAPPPYSSHPPFSPHNPHHRQPSSPHNFSPSHNLPLKRPHSAQNAFQSPTRNVGSPRFTSPQAYPRPNPHQHNPNRNSPHFHQSPHHFHQSPHPHNSHQSPQLSHNQQNHYQNHDNRSPSYRGRGRPNFRGNGRGNGRGRGRGRGRHPSDGDDGPFYRKTFTEDPWSDLMKNLGLQSIVLPAPTFHESNLDDVPGSPKSDHSSHDEEEDELDFDVDEPASTHVDEKFDPNEDSMSDQSIKHNETSSVGSDSTAILTSVPEVPVDQPMRRFISLPPPSRS